VEAVLSVEHRAKGKSPESLATLAVADFI
jgi:hypothetical protein